MTPVISIIIPTYNESESLPPLLSELSRSLASHEIIIADCGSTDGTPELARTYGARVVVSERGRGTQLSEGASAAAGHILFFVHADTQLNAACLNAINEILASDHYIGGNFRLIFDGKDAFSRYLTVLCRIVRFIGIYYGDSGIFVRRQVYDDIGGFKRIAIMEDVDFVRKLENAGKTCYIKNPALVTSSRKFQGRSLFKIAWLWFKMNSLFILGTDPELLSDIYYERSQPGSVKPD